MKNLTFLITLIFMLSTTHDSMSSQEHKVEHNVSLIAANSSSETPTPNQVTQPVAQPAPTLESLQEELKTLNEKTGRSLRLVVMTACFMTIISHLILAADNTKLHNSLWAQRAEINAIEFTTEALQNDIANLQAQIAQINITALSNNSLSLAHQQTARYQNKQQNTTRYSGNKIRSMFKNKYTGR